MKIFELHSEISPKSAGQKVVARSESGMQLTEWVVTAAVLIAVFVVGSQVLRSAVEARANSSVGVVEDTLPCGADLPEELCR